MQSFRSVTSLVLTCTLFLSSTPALAGAFSQSQSDAISYVQHQGFMTGYDNDGFGASHTVNRAEFAKVVTLIYSSQVNQRYTTTLPFRDTANNAWYTPYIVYVYGNGIMSGYSDNTFGPDHAVTFAEAAKVLGIIYHLPMTSTNQWYEGPVRALADRNAIPTSISSVNDPLTRGELADIVYRLDTNDRNETSLSYDDVVRTSSSSYSNTIYRSSQTYRNRYGKSGCGNSNDLSVSINATDTTIQPGDTITYTITLQNCGTRGEQVDTVATLDPQTDFVSASDSGYANGSRTVRWNHTWVDAGDTHTMTLHVRTQSYAAVNDRIDLSVHVNDTNGDSDSDSNTITLSRYRPYTNCYYDSNNNYICNNSTNNCYYDANNTYRCNNSTNNCYYDSHNIYHCDNNQYNNGNTCYYDSHNNYICNNSTNNCYDDSSNHYRCTNNTLNNGDCVYDSDGNLVCGTATNTGTNSNCYYDSSHRYICNNSTHTSTHSTNHHHSYDNNTTNNGDCIYDSDGNLVCGTATNNSNNQCYYDVNNIYRCDNNQYNNGNTCYYDSNNNYICNNSTNNCYYDSNNNYICH